MKTNTKQQLFEFVQQNREASSAEISKQLGISPQMVHRHLKALLEEGKLKKLGRAPRVLYVVNQEGQQQKTLVLSAFPQKLSSYIEQHYLTVKPNGEVLEGFDGFVWWAEKTGQAKNLEKLAGEYVSSHKEFSKNFKAKHGLIDATFKLKDTFGKSYVDALYYQEFYSLPKFGKTKFGQRVFLGKSGQDLQTIKLLANECRDSLNTLIKQHKIEAMVFAPHSIPRKVAFLKEFERFLDLPLPKLELLKIFSGAPVAQKTLQKLHDRIENAQGTIFLKNQKTHFKCVLVIDDAVGSGATINAIAQKLKASGVKIIIGYAITGSLKGFEVINEI